jgi:hypothetical protein
MLFFSLLGLCQDKVKDVIFIADVDFEGQPSDKEFLTQRIKEEYSKSSRLKIANLDHSIKDSTSSCGSDEDCARKEARAIDADQVLITHITKADGLCRVDMRLESIYTKEILKIKNLKSSCNLQDLEDKAVDITYFMMEQNKGIRTERNAEFTSNPAGAKVTINNRLIGVTPVNTKIFTGRARIWMEISNDSRYRPHFTNEFVDDENETFKYNKDFLEQKAYIIFRGAEIPDSMYALVDGVKTEIHDEEKIQVQTSKRINLTLFAKGYFSENKAIPSLEPGQEYEINVNLIPRPCILNLNTEPSSAKISINGEYVGETPFEKEIPGLKYYEVKIEKEFYETETINFRCKFEEKISKDIELEKSKYGYLNLRAVNKFGKNINANIYLNDENTGHSTPHLLTVDANVENEIKLTHNDFIEEEFNVNIEGNATISKKQTMTYRKESYWRFFFGFGFEESSLSDVEWRYSDPNSGNSDTQESYDHLNWSINAGIEREIFDMLALKSMFTYLRDTSGKSEDESTQEITGKPNTIENPVIDITGFNFALSAPLYLFKVDPLLPDRHFGFYISPEVGELHGTLKFKSTDSQSFRQSFVGIIAGLDWVYSHTSNPANFEIGIRRYADTNLKQEGEDEFLPVEGATIFNLRASWSVNF